MLFLFVNIFANINFKKIFQEKKSNFVELIPMVDQINFYFNIKLL